MDSFDAQTMFLMVQEKQGHEIFDGIIAMTCKKHGTSTIYTIDQKFKDIFNLDVRSWR
nr:hypothetical protein [Candidatus Sigynarchaeota archaeon]